MRRLLPAFAVGIIALECVSAAVTAQVVPHPAPVVPSSLKTVPVPLPEQLGDFVVDKSAAIALGKALFSDLQVGGDGQNHTYAASEFPFHQLTNPDDRNSALVRSKDDVSGSHGVHNSAFVDIVPGSAQDNITVVPDPRFQVGGLNTRRVTGRNTPSAINAV